MYEYQHINFSKVNACTVLFCNLAPGKFIGNGMEQAKHSYQGKIDSLYIHIHK